MKYIEYTISQLKRDFPAFLRNKDNLDPSKEKHINVEDANTSYSLQQKFYSYAQKNDLNLGIMFHGAHNEDIVPIFRDGLFGDSWLTGSLSYATKRTNYHERHNKERHFVQKWDLKEVKVLAMACWLTEVGSQM